jgi:hypothetical protein
VFDESLLFRRKVQKLEAAVQECLIPHHSFQAHATAGVGQAELQAYGIAGVNFPGQDHAEAALPNADRASRDSIGNSRT